MKCVKIGSDTTIHLCMDCNAGMLALLPQVIYSFVVNGARMDDGGVLPPFIQKMLLEFSQEMMQYMVEHIDELQGAEFSSEDNIPDNVFPGVLKMGKGPVN